MIYTPNTSELVLFKKTSKPVSLDIELGNAPQVLTLVKELTQTEKGNELYWPWALQAPRCLLSPDPVAGQVELSQLQQFVQLLNLLYLVVTKV